MVHDPSQLSHATVRKDLARGETRTATPSSSTALPRSAGGEVHHEERVGCAGRGGRGGGRRAPRGCAGRRAREGSGTSSRLPRQRPKLRELLNYARRATPCRSPGCSAFADDWILDPGLGQDEVLPGRARPSGAGKSRGPAMRTTPGPAVPAARALRGGAGERGVTPGCRRQGFVLRATRSRRAGVRFAWWRAQLGGLPGELGVAAPKTVPAEPSRWISTRRLALALPQQVSSTS